MDKSTKSDGKPHSRRSTLKWDSNKTALWELDQKLLRQLEVKDSIQI